MQGPPEPMAPPPPPPTSVPAPSFPGPNSNTSKLKEVTDKGITREVRSKSHDHSAMGYVRMGLADLESWLPDRTTETSDLNAELVGQATEKNGSRNRSSQGVSTFAWGSQEHLAQLDMTVNTWHVCRSKTMAGLRACGIHGSSTSLGHCMHSPGEGSRVSSAVRLQSQKDFLFASGLRRVR